MTPSRAPVDPAHIPHDTERRRGSDRNQPGTESAGPRPFSASAAGHRIGPGHPLKVETRVQIPLGLRVRGPGQRPTFGSDASRAERMGRRDPARSRQIPHGVGDHARAPESLVGLVWRDSRRTLRAPAIYQQKQTVRSAVSTPPGWRHAKTITIWHPPPQESYLHCGPPPSLGEALRHHRLRSDGRPWKRGRVRILNGLSRWSRRFAQCCPIDGRV